jgi:nucleotide-binding universal stress UspA family protein
MLILVRRSQHHVEALPTRYVDTPAPPREIVEVPYKTIVVPVKQAGPIEEEMLATAAKLAQAQGGGTRILALRVVEVPLALPLDAPLDARDERAEAGLAALRDAFARDYDVVVETRTIRARAISSAVSDVARSEGAGLILLGAVPHPGATAGRARVFSETVENLLRRAPCRVVVTAFPPGTASVGDSPDGGDGALTASDEAAPTSDGRGS